MSKRKGNPLFSGGAKPKRQRHSWTSAHPGVLFVADLSLRCERCGMVQPVPFRSPVPPCPGRAAREAAR